MKDDDFKLLRGFDNGQADGRIFVIIELLSRLKIFSIYRDNFMIHEGYERKCRN